MSFLAEWKPLAPATDEEIFSTGGSIKEEFTEYISEDACFEIKEEQFDYADKEKDEVNDVKMAQECLFFPNLHDLRHEAYAKDSYNLVQDRDDILRPPLILDNYGNRGSSDGDQAMHNESRKEDTNLTSNHIIVHPKEKPYSCEICNKLFSKKFKLVYHMRVHTKEKPYSCEICNKSFLSKSDLVRHIRIHTNEKPYSCEICNKAFSRKYYLVCHVRGHKKEKPYSCEICSKAYSQRRSLVNHLRVHTQGKPYSCEICNKAFSAKNNLVRHMRIHTNEKPYSCEICNKAFSRKYHLARHMRVHTKKPYSCEICTQGNFI